MSSENVFYYFQSGFRSSFSTDACLTYLTDQIRFQIDIGCYIGMVMMALQNAFDTVDHHILLQKLKALVLGPPAIKRFESYMKKNRINGVFCDPRVLPCRYKRDRFWGHCYILMTCRLLSHVNSFFMLMTQFTAFSFWQECQQN